MKILKVARAVRIAVPSSISSLNIDVLVDASLIASDSDTLLFMLIDIEDIRVLLLRPRGDRLEGIVIASSLVLNRTELLLLSFNGDGGERLIIGPCP